MESFMASAQSQIFSLGILDMLPSFFNVPLVYFFGNPDGSDDFMPNRVLKESFYRTLRQFPILAGHINSRGKGIHEIVVDKHNLNMPEYLESSDESLHFNKLKDANFNFNIWPA
ncbi:hypothetical protein EC988_002867, partial [Linderina pennispora]